MPRKSDRRVPLPDGLLPLVDMKQLETYYDVSDWTVLQWIKQGMPVEPMRVTGARKAARRFDLVKVRAWHAEQQQLAAAS
jgi:phage terminase Nu1 subunit (DNA packaging protein)